MTSSPDTYPPKPWRVLAIAGVVELALLGTLGWWPGATFPWMGLLIFGFAFVAYAVGASQILKTRGGHLYIWFIAIAMRLVLLPLTPELSDDIYRYLWPGGLLIDSPAAPLLARGRGLFDAMARGLDRLAGPSAENPRRMVELIAASNDPLRYYLTLRNGWDLGSATASKLYTDAWRARLGKSTREAFAPYFDRPDLSLVEQVQWAEFRAKMVDDFLLNEDRMSMANSLEVRVPLLDPEMIRFAFDLPLRIKFEGRKLKPVMKRALAPLLPPAVLKKKKWGFSFNPYHQFRKDLRSLCLRELDRRFIEEQGIFRYEFIRGILEARPTPLMRWHYFMIWQILGLKFWQEMFIGGRSYQEIEERISEHRAA